MSNQNPFFFVFSLSLSLSLSCLGCNEYAMEEKWEKWEILEYWKEEATHP